MRLLRAMGVWGGLLLSLMIPQNMVFAEEPPAAEDPSPMHHFLEKYPEVPDFDPVPTLRIRGFGDFTFSASHQNHAYKDEFRFGGVSLLMTSELNRHLSFLSELSSYRDVYYLDNTNPGFLNSPVFEFQRFVLNYTRSDAFNIAAGRYHTALGYWNHTYHHGTWLQPSISRPEIFRFEFEGGVMPEHSVGVELFGFKALNVLDLRYHLGVSNGRGKKLWDVQGFRDENRSKALTLFLTIQPHAIEGLQVGGSFYLDTDPPDTTDKDANGNVIHPNPIDERIAGGHLIYIQERFEFIGEFFTLSHAERKTGLDFYTEGGYLQGAIKSDFTLSYYRYDFVDFAEGNPLFWSFHRDVTKHTIGLRWDMLSWNALKFELSRSKRKNQEPENALLINTSFTF